MVRHAYIFTRYEAHSGVINNAINTGLERGRAIRAMKNAIGIAITAQIAVTLIATNNVRIVTLK